MITIEKHGGVNVLRDDLLQGGTKSILMPHILDKQVDEYVYASPVYGAFQIALSIYAYYNNKKATIFCAQRGTLHPNTVKCLQYNAKIIQVPYGYLNVVESEAAKYIAGRNDVQKLVFGAHDPKSIELISSRCWDAMFELGQEPDEIWCAIGSGTLVESILKSTKTAKVFGVLVGKDYENDHPRLTIMKYPKPFDKEAKTKAPFQSMANYDLKAWEFCQAYSDKTKQILFWNVY
jgi:hypothetical protein